MGRLRIVSNYMMDEKTWCPFCDNEMQKCSFPIEGLKADCSEEDCSFSDNEELKTIPSTCPLRKGNIIIQFHPFDKSGEDIVTYCLKRDKK